MQDASVAALPRGAASPRRRTRCGLGVGQVRRRPRRDRPLRSRETHARNQDETARRVLDYSEPIEIRNGVPILKDGYQVYNYYGVKPREPRLDEMFLRSDRYGDIVESEEPMLSADPVTGERDSTWTRRTWPTWPGRRWGGSSTRRCSSTDDGQSSRQARRQFLEMVVEGKSSRFPTTWPTLSSTPRGGLHDAAPSRTLPARDRRRCCGPLDARPLADDRQGVLPGGEHGRDGDARRRSTRVRPCRSRSGASLDLSAVTRPVCCRRSVSAWPS